MVNLSGFKLSKKVILALVVVALVGEGIWAYQTLSKKSAVSGGQTPVPSTTSSTKPKTTLLLQSSQNTIKIGDKLTVAVNIAADKATDGVDIIILYDPKLLTVVPVEGTKNAMMVGSIYSDYPINAVDGVKGKITVSGITTQVGGVVPRGTFGSITFTAKAAGQAKISLDFTKGSTVDSNVIETKTAKDLLEEIRNTEVNITP
ncbi:hypothetical protein HY385_03155 [Candidatus Daviesbacteria bacterium]|nr:hypothetical protein [Candidatus Daviesbacteria bacterium]